MKKILFSLVSLVFLLSCVEEKQEPVKKPEPFRIEAGFNTDDTKTVFNPSDNSVAWEATDALAVLVNDGSATAAYKFTKVADIDNAFECEDFAPVAGKTYTYSILYPYNEHFSSLDADGFSNAFVELPSRAGVALSQNGVGDAAHVKGALCAQTTVVGTDEPSVMMSHLTHIFKATITNDTEDALTVTNVALTNDASQTLSGTYYVNCSTGAVKSSGDNYVSESVSVNVTGGAIAAGETGVVYIVTPAFTIPAEKKLTFTVTCAEGKAEIVKTMTEELVCAAGEIRPAALVINSENFTAKPAMSTLSGDYVVVAENEGAYYALTSTAEASRLNYKTLTDFDPTVGSYDTSDNTIIWTVEASEGKYTLKNLDNLKYLSFSGTKNSATTSAEAYAVSISQKEDGKYNITTIYSDEERILAKNTNSSYGFAFYGLSTNGYKDLHIVRVAADTREQLATPENLNVELAEGTTNSVKVTWDAVADATGYSVTCGEASQVVTETTATFTGLTYAEHTIKVVAQAEGYKDSEAAQTTYTLNAPDGLKAEWEEVTDLTAALPEGTYIYVAVQDGTYYYMKNVEVTSGGDVKPGTMNSLPSTIGFTASDDMKLTISGTADGYSIYNGTYYLGTTDANNGVTFKDGNSEQKWKLVSNENTNFTFCNTSHKLNFNCQCNTGESQS